VVVTGTELIVDLDDGMTRSDRRNLALHSQPALR
jgi:hypothetical protein